MFISIVAMIGCGCPVMLSWNQQSHEQIMRLLQPNANLQRMLMETRRMAKVNQQTEEDDVSEEKSPVEETAPVTRPDLQGFILKMEY